MQSRAPETTFIEINGLNKYELILTYFVPDNEDEYLASADLSSPSLPFSLTSFDSLRTRISGSCVIDASKVVNEVLKFKGVLEILGVGLDLSLTRSIQIILSHHKSPFKWHENMDEMEAKRIHNQCTKLRIDVIKMGAQCKIKGLMEEFT